MGKAARAARRVAMGSVATAAVVASVVGTGVAGAGAAPVKPKTAVSGTFSDCSNGRSGTFVVNDGKSNGAAWSAAQLKFADGSRGVFTPTALDLTITVDGQVVGTQVQHKHPKRNSVTCTIAATTPDGASLSGTVIGKMTTNGK